MKARARNRLRENQKEVWGKGREGVKVRAINKLCENQKWVWRNGREGVKVKAINKLCENQKWTGRKMDFYLLLRNSSTSYSKLFDMNKKYWKIFKNDQSPSLFVRRKSSNSKKKIQRSGSIRKIPTAS